MVPHAPPRTLLPPIPVSVAAALSLAALSWTLYGVDVDAFLLPWFAHIRAAGPVAAFATPFSNYAPPYLYLMAAVSPGAAVLPEHELLKLLSFAGHALLALSMWRLLASCGHPRPARAAALLVLAPTLLVSPAVMTQCDAFWAAALVLALAAAVEHRHASMFAWCGAAVAFKLQAAFAGPFFLALALARGVPFRFWLAAPAVAVGLMLPAWFAGWPAADLLTIYLRQAEWEDALALSAPNVWMVVQSTPLAASAWLGGVAMAAAVTAGLGYVAYFARRLRGFGAVDLVRAACLCALLVPGLLPRMHERYFFLSDVLALVIAALRPAEWRLAFLTQLGSGLAILSYMTGATGLAVCGAAAMIAATWLAARPFLPGARRRIHGGPSQEDIGG